MVAGEGGVSEKVQDMVQVVCGMGIGYTSRKGIVGISELKVDTGYQRLSAAKTAQRRC
jgi:hypothetical protein